MHLTNLYEAGIRTAAIDLQARRALAAQTPAFVDRTVETLSSRIDLGPLEPGQEVHGSADVYDAIWQLVHNAPRPDALWQRFAAFFSQTLGDVVRGYIETLVTSDERLKRAVQDGWRTTPEQFAHGFRIQIEPKQDNEDEHAKHYGGYYNDWSKLLKVFVDQHAFDAAIWSLIQVRVLGESDEDGVGDLLRVVMPTFVHEYAHAEQSMRRLAGKWLAGNGNIDRKPGRTKPNPNGHGVDFGYITVGRKGNRRVPKRGGELRTPEKSPEHRLRYYGATHEIDSFASGAAAALIQQTLRDEQRNSWRSRSSAERNRDIDAIQQSLGYDAPWSDEGNFGRYYRLVRDSFEGLYRDQGIDLEHAEVEKVWKRFVRLVKAKLDDYRAPTAGAPMTGRIPAEPRYVEKRFGQDRESFDKQFLQIAETESFAETVRRLARISARRYVRDQPWIDDHIAHARNYGGFGHHSWDAMAFIREYYFNTYEDDAQIDKTEAIFKRIMERYVRYFAEHYKNNELDRAA